MRWGQGKKFQTRSLQLSKSHAANDMASSDKAESGSVASSKATS